MDRLIAPNTVTAAQADTAPATGTPGYATDGNPASNIPATRWPAYQYNAIQEELMAIIAAGGLMPDRTNNAQVAAAITRICLSTAVLADTGAANAYAAANTPPLTVLPSTGFIQRISIAHANTGASTYAPDGLTAKPIYGLGLQPLQGGELVVNGIATLIYLVAPTVNSGNGAWILLGCTGAAQQVAPATQSGHAVQLGQVAGVVGSARNLKMSVTAASASATLMADEIIVETALGGLRYCLANFNETINLAIVGAGGMDTGAAPVSGYVALYAIYNPITGSSALLAKDATSSIQPNVYGGSSLPSGYTASALISVWPTNASGQFVVGLQSDRTISIVFQSVLTSSVQQSSAVALSVAGVIPKNARSISGSMAANSTSAGTLSINVSGSASRIGEQGLTSNSTGGSAPYSKVSISTPQTLYYLATATAGTPNFQIYISSYEI
ncbi:hypothetical protein QZM92_23445 [Burkholderia multivorans]|nr:hypothetical protein [Burkholderia multivorans]